MRNIVRIAFLIAAVFAAGGAGAEESAKQRQTATLKIGALCPLEGRYATLGESFLRGASIALKEARLRGINNIEIVIGDTRGAPLACRSAAERLIEEERVDALLGEVLSSSTIAAAQVAELAHVVLLSPVATEEGIDDIGRWVFQTSPGAETEIAALSRMACDRLGLRRFAYLSSDDPASRRGAALFAQEIERLGGRLVAAEFYPAGSTDFTEILKRLVAAAPEALYIGSEIEDLTLILPQLSFHEFGVQILGSSSWDSRRLIRMAGRDLEGAIFPVDIGARKAERQFVAACAAVDEPPGERNQVMVGAYQGTRMLIDAMAKVKGGGEALREEMSRTLEKRRHPYLDLVSGEGIPFYIVRGEKLVDFETLRVGP